MRPTSLAAITIGLLVVRITLAASQRATVATADTALTLNANDDGITISSLNAAGSAAQWAASARQRPLPMRWVDRVQVDGKDVPVRWRLQPLEPAADARVPTFVFLCDQPRLRLTSTWRRFDGPGPIEHQIRIENRGTKDVLVGWQASLIVSGRADHGVEAWWVEKGGGTPTAVGIHRTPVTAAFSAKLKSGPLAVGEPRDPIPFVAFHDVAKGGGWYAGVEFSGRIMMTLKAREAAGGVVDVDLGLEPKADLLTRVPPGEAYEPPATFVGCFAGDLDDCGNRFRKWVADHLRPAVHDPKYPLLVNNSWGSGMAVDEKLARSMIDQSAELGLEMFHIDAGWFRTVGDWRANPKKFPHGLAPVADYAHAKGLRFGLWVGWTQAGNEWPVDDPSHVLSVRDPSRRDWIPDNMPPDWKPNEFSGETVCLADPRTEAWCLELLKKVVRENKLDMLEHDQRMIVDNCMRTDHRHTKARVDVAFRAGEAYYRIYDALRRENPNLLFEDCVNGGQMVDFGVIRRVHYISITDTYDPLSNRRAFYDSSHLIPPAMCECYVAQQPGKTAANFLYMLRSGMMGWCTIMLDTTQWTPRQHELAKRQFEIYKTRLRPLINHADLYHVSERPDGVRWDGIEYFDPKTGSGALFAFRGKTDEPKHAFVLRGLDPKASYDLEFEDGGSRREGVAGSDLTRTGLLLALPEPESSQIVYIRRRGS